MRASVGTSRDAFLSAARTRLPPDTVSTEPEDLVTYGRDWTRRLEPQPSVLARPRSAAEVVTLVGLCREHHLPIVPSGGRTGLAGGAVATAGELVLSLERMRRLDPVDAVGGTVRVEAGVVTQAVHDHTRPHGLTWPVDFASKGSSTVGGNLATNAGGVRVVRYGTTRRWVLGVEVVLASGVALSLGGALEKDNSGMPLKELFIGSEGTLGIITAATLKLAPLPSGSRVALLGLTDVSEVVDVFRRAVQGRLSLSAYEFFSAQCLARVRRHRRLRAPLASEVPWYALVEVEGDGTDLESFTTELLQAGTVVDGTLSDAPSRARALWEYREAISESLSATGRPHKQDVSVPIAKLPAFILDLEALTERHLGGREACLFGHIGDGNVHVNLMRNEGESDVAFETATREADERLFDLVRRHAGSISAEHGIGLLKKPYLAYTRSAEQIDVMRAVKRALDPESLMNPGKVFD